MHHHTLRELAKIAVGLFIADIICGLWFGSAGLLPITVFGVTWTGSYLLPGIIFDLAVILLLAHYAWNMQLPVKSPSERTLLLIAGLVFLAVAVLHLLRLGFSWHVAVGSVGIPLWLSWLGVIFAAYLSYSSFHFALRKR